MHKPSHPVCHTRSAMALLQVSLEHLSMIQTLRFHVYGCAVKGPSSKVTLGSHGLRQSPSLWLR